MVKQQLDLKCMVWLDRRQFFLFNSIFEIKTPKEDLQTKF